MQSFFDINNHLFSIMAKICDAILLNILWVIASLPIVTIGAASNAAYETLQIVILRDEYTIWYIFWNAYKRRIGQAILQTVLYELALFGGLVIILTGYMYYRNEIWIGAVYLATIILLLAVIGMLPYHFSLLRSTSLPFGAQFSVAFVLSMKHFPQTVLLVGLIMAGILAVEWFFFLLLFLPTTLFWLSGHFLEKTAKQHAKLIQRIAYEKYLDDPFLQNKSSCT